MATLTPGFADTWDMAPLPKPMENLADFAGVCCSNPSCGPHMENACKKMQQEVARRQLDEETIRKRLRVYQQQTEPLVAYYRDRGLLREVVGTGSVDEISDRIGEALGA